MQSIIFQFIDFLRGRWVSLSGKNICRTYEIKVACVLAFLIWHYPATVKEAMGRLWNSHFTDLQAWTVVSCLGLLIGTIIYFEWLGHQYSKNLKKAEWRVPVIRLS